jgi:hypothetical protein
MRWLVDIAGIVGGVIAALVYFGIQPNVLDQLPEKLKAQAEAAVESATFEVDEKKYFSEGNKGYLIYKAAIVMESSYSKDNALIKSISASLADNDYKIALLAAKNIESSYTKDQQLYKIAVTAAAKSNTIGYSIVAAELAESSYKKDNILQIVVRSFSGGKLPVLDKSADDDQLDISKMTKFDKYKLIYKFADSGSYMDLSEKDAKKFADDWIKSRTFENFLQYKKIYIFADSGSYMDLSENDAKEFADNWIGSKSFESFLQFKKIYIFADSGSGMSLDEGEAKKFALDWMEKKFTDEDFATFSDAFKFAYTSSGMDMDTDEAIEFAFMKVKERKDLERKATTSQISN